MSEYVGVPDGFTPVVGWRAWKLAIFDHTKSVYLQGHQGYWQTEGPTRAYCGNAPVPSTARSPGRRNYIHVPNPNYETEMRQWRAVHGGCTSSEYDPVSGAHIVKSGPVAISVTRPVEAGPTQIPSSTCSCGLYVASKLEGARKYLYPVTDYGSDFGVIGRAALWGRVVEHETGARGEYAYPQAFYVPDAKFDKAAPKLRETFKVPVFRMSELPDAPKTEPYAYATLSQASEPVEPSRRHWHLRAGLVLWAAVAVNLAAAAWNIVSSLMRHA